MGRTGALPVANLTAAGLILAALGGWVVWREASVYYFNAGSPIKSVHMRNGDELLPLWTASRRELLEECEAVLRSANAIELRLMPSVTHQSLRQTCAQEASRIAAATPTFSLAWAVSAMAAAHEQDWVKMNEALRMSRTTGANEQWVGRVRFQVAEEHLSHLTVAERQGYEEDLKLLILSQVGVRQIAGLYLLKEGFGERLLSVLTTLPEDEQRRFLYVLRTLAGLT